MRPIDTISKRENVDSFYELIKSDYSRETKLKTPKSKDKNKNSRVLKSFLAILVICAGVFATAIADDVIALTSLAKLLGSGRFLVLFQNNAELRPTGGFLGSFALINTKGGKIDHYHVEGNIYKADNEFIKTHKIPAPEPFNKIWSGSLLAFNGSNWSPDFSTSAEQVLWFYEQEYGDSTVDGVIAINSTAVAKLMRLAGTIDLPDYGVTFTPENFLATLQKYVEKDYYQNIENQNQNEPKGILNDLGAQFVSRIAKTNPLSLANYTIEFIKNRELQFYFKDHAKQALVAQMNWSLEIPDWNGNYFYINNANLGGGKGSLNVAQSIRYEIKPNKDGTSEVLVSVLRNNLGREDYPVSDNINYTRVYVPAGSSLNYAFIESHDITEQVETEIELQKTVFGFWLDTPVGQKKKVVLSYTVPALKESRLWIEHQPGTREDLVEIIGNSQQIFSGELLTKKIIDTL